MNTHHPPSASLSRSDVLVLAAAAILMLPAFVFMRLRSMFTARYRPLYDVPAGFFPVYDSLPKYFIIALFLLGILLLFVGEWRSQVVTRFLLWLGEHTGWQWFILILLFVAASSGLLLPGYVLSNDGGGEAALSWTIHEALRHGDLFVRWSNHGFMGFAMGQFRSPLYHYLVALVMFVLPDVFTASKAVVAGSFVLSGLAMFSLARRWHKPAGGLLAALGWTLSFYHYQSTVYIGRYHVTLVYVFLPLILLFIERIVAAEKPRFRDAALLAVALWLTAQTHVTTGGLVLGFALVFAVLRAATSQQRSHMRRRIGVLTGGFTSAMMLIIPRVVPVMAEGHLTLTLSQYYNYFQLGTIGLRELFVRDIPPTNVYGGYMGNSIVLLAVTGAIYGVWRKPRYAAPLLLWLVLSAYLVLGPQYLPFDQVFQKLPLGHLVYAGKTPGQFGVLLLFCLCLFAGFAVDALCSVWERLGGKTGEITRLYIGGGLILLVAMDLLLFSLDTYLYIYEYPRASLEPVVEWFRTRHDDDYSRIIDTGYDMPAVEMALYGHPGLFATHEEVPARSGQMVYSAYKTIVDDLSHGKGISPLSRQLLYILDVGYVLTAHEVTLPGAVNFSDSAEVIIPVDSHSPALASHGVQRVQTQTTPVDSIASMVIDYEDNAADFIPIVSRMPVDCGTPGAGQPALEVTDYIVEPQYLRLDFTLSEPACVALAWAYYDYLQVDIDGEVITPFETAYGTIGFTAGAGPHRVEIKPVMSPVRRVSLGIALAGAGLAVVLFWVDQTAGDRRGKND